MKNEKIYYLGLDIGTDSVGYAVTNESYELLKFHGEPAWGVTVFDEASLSADRRSFRTARRRLDRRRQRVALTQELFAQEIEKVDSRFFLRLRESYLFRGEAGEDYSLFNDEGFTDKEYYAEYPTIHHLICELMDSKEPHDVRLVYLACSWLVAHRGHFLSNISRDNISAIKDFSSVYDGFFAYFTDNGFALPWEDKNREAVADILKRKMGVVNKTRELTAVLLDGAKAEKKAGVFTELPFSQEGMIKLLAGGTYSLSDLFGKEEYADLEVKSVALSMDDEKLGMVMADIGEDYELIAVLRSIYDWAVLIDVLRGKATISEAKKADYEQHCADLKLLKKFVKKYKPEKYDEVFRATDKDNYSGYVYHTDETDISKFKKKDKEAFSKYILSVFTGVEPEPEDAEAFESMKNRLALRTFMPKQKDTDNRVIPHQLYWYELHKILENASGYLPFLTEKDEDGLTVSEKLESVFLFRIPYFVGPLNTASSHAWLKREKGKIYPWNFEKMVDLDASEQNFIQRMTNFCTYLPGEPVLPKDSLLYHKFTVLNEINNIKINGVRVSVELKQRIYREVFLQKKKVTHKRLIDFLLEEGEIQKGEEDSVTGIDINIKSNLTSQIAFKRLLESGTLTEADAERIIERASYAEDKTRLSKWLAREYPDVSEADRKYICSIKLKDFGRLSRRFLSELEGVNKETGEVCTIIGALWSTQNNLMELLSEKFTFGDEVRKFADDYYSAHPVTLTDRLDEMYVSNAVKRQIFRTFAIVKDVTKAFGQPSKIFIEMARGGTADQKGKRTKSRKQQILDLYAKCKDEDVRILRRQLEEMGNYADNRLQGDKLFLYFMQLGKCIYSGEPIDLERLGTKAYDIDHIYPQAFIKDDSILNNRVLCLSSLNGEKSDTYPLSDSIRHKMKSFWDYLKSMGLIEEEKYKRLVRATPFTDEEKYAFVSRQLTETTQSTKAVASLLAERFPDTEIVYCKARLASEFRQEFDLYKSRAFNDLHHAVDAYLNIVTGNVYNSKFTKTFNYHSSYSIKTKTLFTHPVTLGNKTVWDGENMLAFVKKTAVKNTAHFTKYSFFKKGGLFDQMPVRHAEGLVPLKKGLDTAKYGGYNGAGIMFYIPVKYTAGKKSAVIIMSVELLHGRHFLKDEAFAREYSLRRLEAILGKTVSSVEFPMGMRPWKVNTVLSLDGFRVCISGSAGKGKCLIAQPIVQFSADKFWQFYLKKLEMLVEKTAENKNYIFSEEFDKVSREKNLELYDLYIDKLTNSIYSKRINNPVETLVKGKDLFIELSETEQAKALLNIHQVFGRLSNGCDLTAVGGTAHAAATVNFSSTVSNWAKTFKDVRLIDVSPSGLWERSSDNLLELL